MNDERHCERCGKHFCGPRNKRFCSRNCSSYHSRGIPYVEKKIVCIGCEQTVVRTKHIKSLYCSAACQQANNHKIRSFIRALRKVLRLRGIEPIEPVAISVRNCDHCGKQFSKPLASTKRFCSPSCGNNSHNKHKIFVGRFGEPADRIDRYPVCVAFNWTCCRCGAEVHLSKSIGLQHDHLTATIDHILPKEHGGKHVWNNIQLLCIKCNVAKGTKISGQLPLQLGFLASNRL